MKYYFGIIIAIVICFNFDSMIASPVSSFQEVSDNEVDTEDNDKIDLKDLENVMYGVPSEETGKKVAELDENFGGNPEELGKYAEGDILFPATSLRTAFTPEYTRWPNTQIPYMLSPAYNYQETQLIRKGINEIEKHTCIRFINRTGESAYIQITSGFSGCWSSVGHSGSRVYVNLQRPGCVKKIGTIIHELLHALGFIHEQSRSDRDEKVSIQWQNVKSGSENNFVKYSQTTVDDFGISYDYGSVMHYSDRAFSANGYPTIVPKGNQNVRMGQRDGLSQSDIIKINRMYCNGKRQAREDKHSNTPSTTSRWDCLFGMLC